MTERVIGLSGKAVLVSTPDDLEEEEKLIPGATSLQRGLVSIGDNIQVSGDGVISVPNATPTMAGVVTMCAQIMKPDSIALPDVTDIDSAAESISAIKGVLQSLIVSMIAAGMISP